MKINIHSAILLTVISVFARAQTSHFNSPYNIYSYDLTREVGRNSDIGKQIATIYDRMADEIGTRSQINVNWTNGTASASGSVGFKRAIAIDLTSGSRVGVNAQVLTVDFSGSVGTTETNQTSFMPKVVNLGGGIARIEMEYTITLKTTSGLTQISGTLFIGSVSLSEPNAIYRASDSDTPIYQLNLGWISQNASIPLFETSWTSSYETWDGTHLTIHNVSISVIQTSSRSSGPRNAREE
tara:strand:+ start:186 stop:905 length:720 start_codon:yes stop_codon:yes gene_type:complete